MSVNYENEARERWGDTDVYREHEQKIKNYTKEKWTEANEGLMAIFAEFAACKARGESIDSFKLQMLVAKLQAYITDNYYTCTNDILKSLGDMYTGDERFKNNINKLGVGTAEYISEAISVYFQPTKTTDDPVLEKYWGDRKYKRLQCYLEKQLFSKEEKSKMSMHALDYIDEKGYVIYHDFMDDIAESHPDWFNMITFDKNCNKAILMYIKSKAKSR